MPNLSALVASFSTSVNAGLAASGNFPLTDGKILLGKQHDFEHSDAPRIIFTPSRSVFAAKDTAMGTAVGDATRPPFEQVIGSEMVTFEVRCWGIGPPDESGGTNPDDDYDGTQALYQQVIATANEIANGCYTAVSGDWTEDVQNVRRGREFVFQLTINTPVYARLPLANLASPVPAPNPPTNYAPDGTTGTGHTIVTLTNPSGTSGSETI